MANDFPYEIKLMDHDINEELKKDFEGRNGGYCQVGPQKWCFLEHFSQQANGFYNMELRKDDLWIVSFPRSGTTWCQELLWMVNNDLDYKTSAEVPLDIRFPFADLSILMTSSCTTKVKEQNNHDPKVVKEMNTLIKPTYDTIKDLPSPRHLKTHLPFSLLPPSLIETCKVVYIARNPLDVIPSYYHLHRMLSFSKFTGDFKKYWRYFRDHLVTYAPYWPHLQQAWEIHKHPNVLFLFYEDLVKDLPKAIKQVSVFLNKPVSEEQVTKLAEHLHIDNFRKTVKALDLISIKGMVVEGEQGFVRNGKVGQHYEFTEELKKEAEEWIAEHLAKTDLRFPSV